MAKKGEKNEVRKIGRKEARGVWEGSYSFLCQILRFFQI